MGAAVRWARDILTQRWPKLEPEIDGFTTTAMLRNFGLEAEDFGLDERRTLDVYELVIWRTKVEKDLRTWDGHEKH